MRAYALDIGLAGLSTLEALARAALPRIGSAPAILCVAMEAGRGEVYAAVFRVKDGEPARETPDLSHKPADLLRALPSGTRLAGDGSATLERAAREAGRTIEAIDPSPPLAGSVALWGCRSLPPGTPYLPGGARPNYVRPYDAEVPKR